MAAKKTSKARKSAAAKKAKPKVSAKKARAKSAKSAASRAPKKKALARSAVAKTPKKKAPAKTKKAPLAKAAKKASAPKKAAASKKASASKKAAASKKASASKKATTPKKAGAPKKTTAPKAAVHRRDGTGHLDPKYAAMLREKSREGRVEDREEAFVGSGPKDDLAEEMGETWVETATTGEDTSQEVFSQDVPEDEGGPFVTTTAGQEFAEGTDASNPKTAKREPFPRT